jgi:hypothetical protein
MNLFFRYLSVFPLPLWVAMMVAPRHPLTERLSRSSTIFIIAALHYIAAMVMIMFKHREEDITVQNFTSLESVNRLMATRSGTLAAWAHMLVLDLFTGAWIYRECRRLDAPAWVRIPSLFSTLMAGPSGLLVFLTWRLVATRSDEHTLA